MRPFFIVWSGQAISLLGSQIVQFALVWWLARTTGSATILATAALVALLPQVLLGPFVGVWVDRWNRKRIMLASDTLIAFASLILGWLYLFDLALPVHVFWLLGLRAIAGVFHRTAMTASTTLMVPAEHLTRVQGMNQSLHAGLGIASAPLGGLAIGLMPMAAVVAIDIASALFAILPLLFIHIPQPTPSSENRSGDEPSFSAELKVGLSYLRSQPGLLSLVAMVAVVNLAMVPAFSLLPLLVTSHFERSALELGWMTSLFGVGALAGGLLLAAWGGFRPRILTALAGLIGIGGSSLALGLMPATAFNGGLIAIFLVGFMQPLTNGPIHAVVQSIVPPDVQGRVFSLMGSVATAMAPIGLAVAGPVSDLMGIRIWFIAGGVVCIAVGIASLGIRSILEIESHVTRTASAHGSASAAT